MCGSLKMRDRPSQLTPQHPRPPPLPLTDYLHPKQLSHRFTSYASKIRNWQYLRIMGERCNAIVNFIDLTLCLQNFPHMPCSHTHANLTPTHFRQIPTLVPLSVPSPPPKKKTLPRSMYSQMSQEQIDD